jgi:hypothetical protein
VLVLVCGMHRSGSTLVWQITRLLLEGQPGLRNPRDVELKDFAGAAADPDDLLMAKVHYRPTFTEEEFPREGAIYLYTYRDLRDAIASLYRKGRYTKRDPRRGPRNSRLAARRELAGNDMWTSMPGVWVAKYEDFRDDVPGLVRNLATTLQIDLTEERLAAICAEVDIDAQKQRVQAALVVGIDEDSRITQNHITDGREGAWRDTLTEGELGAIELESGAWLVTHGYTVETKQGKLNIARTRRKIRTDGPPQTPERDTATPAQARPARRPVPAVIPHAKVWAIVLAALTAVSTVLAIGIGSNFSARLVLSILAVGFAGACGIIVGRVQQHRQR